MIKVLRYTASYCGPCQMLKPIFEQLQSENPSVEFQTIDIDNENPHSIRAVPTIIIFKNNIEQYRVTGLRSKHFYQDYINLLLK